MKFRALALAAAMALTASVATAQPAQEPPRERPRVFTASDVFSLEYADNPRISPDGRWVAYVRVSADIMTDRFKRSIWLVDSDGRTHRPLVQGQPARGDGDQRQRQRQDDEEQQLDGQVADAAHASGAASSPRAMARVTASVRVAAWSLP